MKNSAIALKNLTRQKKRTVFLAGAIAFGIIAVTLLDSMVGSFINNIARNFSDIAAGHIFIEGKEKTETGKNVSVIRDSELIDEAIRNSNIEYRFITKRSSFRGALYFEGQSVNQEIVGADWDEEGFFTQRIQLKEGSFEELKAREDGIIISQDVADILNAKINDRITVKLRTARGQQNSAAFYVAGISIDPNFIGSISSYANIDYVNRQLDIGENDYMSLGIYLYDIKDTEKYKAPLRDSLAERVSLTENDDDDDSEQDMFEAMMQAQEGEETWEGVRYSMTTINEMLSELKDVIRIIEQASLIFFLVLMLIIMVGINNTFRIVMFERIGEIGTMRAIGAQKVEIRTLFLMEAFFISLVGLAIGFIISGLAMGIISAINLGMDNPIFIVLKNGHFTFKLNLINIVRNILLVSFLTILAALLPAIKAAKLEPAAALRTQK